jgi:hypothetical protein
MHKQSIVHFQIVESKGDPGPDREGKMVDYSQGGMRFSAKQPLQKNTKIYIKLDSEEWGKELTVVWRNPDRSLLEVIGSVMWCLESPETPGEFEVGARFVEGIEQ